MGRKLFGFLESQPGVEVSGLDMRAVDHPRIHLADFTADPAWAEHFEGMDVIVHLAGDRDATANRDSAIRNNMDSTLAIYHEAAGKGVSGVVFAGLNWLRGDQRFTADALTTQATPGPINPYGMLKLFCERTGAYFAKHNGLSVVCRRIGWAHPRISCQLLDVVFCFTRQVIRLPGALRPRSNSRSHLVQNTGGRSGITLRL